MEINEILCLRHLSAEKQANFKSVFSNITLIAFFGFLSICLIIALIVLIIIGIKGIIKRRKNIKYLLNLYNTGKLNDDSNLIKEINSLGVDFVINFLFDFILKTKKLKENINENCIICLGELAKNEKIVITVCEHNFHYKCFKIYLNELNKLISNKIICNKLSCPLCKQSLFIIKQNLTPSFIRVNFKGKNQQKYQISNVKSLTIFKKNNLINKQLGEKEISTVRKELNEIKNIQIDIKKYKSSSSKLIKIIKILNNK